MDKLENRLKKMENFVKRHRVGIAIAGTTAFCVFMNRVALKQHEEFLADKGLLEEFYTQKED